MLLVSQFGITKKNLSPVKGFTAPKTYLYSLTYMMTGNTGSKLIAAPAILRLVNSSKTCFAFKH